MKLDFMKSLFTPQSLQQAATPLLMNILIQRQVAVNRSGSVDVGRAVPHFNIQELSWKLSTIKSMATVIPWEPAIPH